MASEENPKEKKDMTSLFDLARREPLPEPADGGALVEQPPAESVTDADFGSLEDLARAAAAAPVPLSQGSGSFASPDMSIPPPPAGESVTGLEGLDFGGELPADVLMVDAPPAEPETPVPLDDLPAEPQMAAPALEVEPLPPPAEEPPTSDGEAPVVAPSPNSQHSLAARVAPKGTQNMDALKKFGEKFAIGHPCIEASPAFSLMAAFVNSEKVVARIKDALSAEDYGVQFADIEVQMKGGKLLVPKISEFAAVSLAMKLRDVVDDIEIGLSSEIFKAKTPGVSDSDFDNVLFTAENMQLHSEDVKDMGAEPKTEKELFATNLDQIEGYKVTRILTAITVSKIVPNEIAEDPKSGRLEDETDVLTRELVARAFKSGAHGIIGLSFTLKPYEIEAPLGKKRAYRLWGSGTAVRVRTVAPSV